MLFNKSQLRKVLPGAPLLFLVMSLGIVFIFSAKRAEASNYGQCTYGTGTYGQCLTSNGSSSSSSSSSSTTKKSSSSASSSSDSGATTTPETGGPISIVPNPTTTTPGTNLALPEPTATPTSTGQKILTVFYGLAILIGLFLLFLFFKRRKKREEEAAVGYQV